MIHPEEIIDFIVKNSESLYPSLGVYEYVFNNKNAVKFLNLLKQNGLECKNIEIFEKEKNAFKHAYGWFNTEMNDNEYLTDYLERNILLSIDYINNTNFTIKNEKLYFNIVWDYRIIEPEIIYKLNNK